MNKKLFIAAVAMCCFRATSAPAQCTESTQAAIDRYRAAIRSAETGHSPRSIETAFAALASVRDALLPEGGGPGDLETLSDEEFLRVVREIPGALINREEVVFVEPDPDYFVRLAAAVGDDADREFFRALKLTYPTGAWPLYIEQETDYSGCARLGSMSFVETYRTWINFQNKYPDRYPTAANEEVDSLLDNLTHSTCACGDMAAVMAEFQRFLELFPASPAWLEVERRLDAARAGKSDIRVNCASD